jgi:hypothetical protein
VPAMRSQSKTRADAEARKGRRYVVAGFTPSGSRSESCGSFVRLRSNSRIILPVGFKWAKSGEIITVPSGEQNLQDSQLPLVSSKMFEKLEKRPFWD